MEIQVMPACKWRLPVLPVLTYPKVRCAPVLGTQLFGRFARPSSTPTRTDLNFNTSRSKVRSGLVDPYVSLLRSFLAMV
ncbi:MAG: hypothetical protein E5X83_06875 [Mesorhizobium sp.]|nr:MAG: hypothetical protein EOR82_13830 [Mesorhizobium sp.]TIO27032.1 MAG: hypothetical protein E5X83_06875 [Mesorhizobium sp.]TJV60452.1 MAG: hypothetical protein E5X82_13645 [Mesorhizobium sp.]